MREGAILAVIYLVTGIILFAMMGLDKAKARSGAWRIPEAQLFLLALLGGAMGGVLAMRVFHHKTKHLKFKLGFPLIAAVQLFALLYLIFNIKA